MFGWNKNAFLVALFCVFYAFAEGCGKVIRHSAAHNVYHFDDWAKDSHESDEDEVNKDLLKSTEKKTFIEENIDIASSGVALNQEDEYWDEDDGLNCDDNGKGSTTNDEDEKAQEEYNKGNDPHEFLSMKEYYTHNQKLLRHSNAGNDEGQNQQLQTKISKQLDNILNKLDMMVEAQNQAHGMSECYDDRCEKCIGSSEYPHERHKY